jgi:CopG family transcriptional regulator, nickel-responsive regulator
MTIISISLNEKILKQINELEKEQGYSGRSEVIRAGIRQLISDKKEKSKLKGNVDAVLIIIHDEKYSERVTTIRHKHQHIIKTQIHNHLENHKCLEVFILNGDSEEILTLVSNFETEKKMDLVKLIVS